MPRPKRLSQALARLASRQCDHDGDMSDGSGFGHRIRPETIDENSAVTAPLEAGGAVFFHDLTMHASHPNTERRERWTWVPTYRDAQADDPPYSFEVANVVVRESVASRGSQARLTIEFE